MLRQDRDFLKDIVYKAGSYIPPSPIVDYLTTRPLATIFYQTLLG